ncbi:hypothetical protein CGSMWGv75712_03775 [Gardnerella vaginalis 75712]|nr:hypothetical protein CGSMWGv75712_03775 [Gardnerella vaginalis 75712]
MFTRIIVAKINKIIENIAKALLYPLDIIAALKANPTAANPPAIEKITSHPRLTPNTRKTSEISQVINPNISANNDAEPNCVKRDGKYFIFLDFVIKRTAKHNPDIVNILIGSMPFIRLIVAINFILTVP